MPLFDSHCHLNHLDFADDYTEVWNKSRASGIEAAVVIGFDLDSSRKAIEITEELPGLYASVGVSPHDIQAAPEDYITQIQSLATHPKVVAIGETGLEYNYDVGPKELQHKIFIDQIEVANEMRKPVVIHLRDADQDFLSILQNHPPYSAILHCFTATMEIMETCVQKGYGISLSGISTFKNAKDLHALIPHIPESCLLIETDSPYLAPVPYRGKRCEPWMLTETARHAAQQRQQSLESISQITVENAKRIFGLA